MDLQYCLGQLSINAIAIQRLLEGVSDIQATWRPAEMEWSLLEVINHLVDEEKEDFRFRLDHLFSSKTIPWPANAPEKWVCERRYNQRDFQESIEKYTDERRKSLEWLKDQIHRDYSLHYVFPPLVGLSAGDLLASWVAHDLLHLRQMVELKWKYSMIQTQPFSNEYAGDW
jgi:hypothetical protein